MSTPCPFCNLPAERILAANEHGVVIRDAYPVSPGHSLIISRRHAGSFFDLSAAGRAGLMALLEAEKIQLDEEYQPDAYNIGINDGASAGQTVPHVHIHLIPRYAGDAEDPRGGVRWVLPDQAKYWP